ncbi:xanthine dehydrogenase YagS FAD-binding subunit [Ilumatobacter fluminis]|uniref:Xanthine dehydrogenase YagS FAD-binding subunit n=1 Tax=Ilumatobacter fluminis TaxID=467091 RepID=A0A4R7I3G5_9ACTN|nr:FAD binding domain-containing protein [Ilumatobacter fluminis]TDT18177.1 xanthine dehydrogenase YagS FAD-binding subunit [Ilumatobacter fluminis]
MTTTTRYEPYVGDALADDAEFIAGGTDLVTLMRGGLRRPTAVVDLKAGDLSVGVTTTEDGWRIGAGTTLAMIEEHAELIAGAPVLSQAAAQAATRQIRNRATIAGNLLQRSRCSYFRDEDIPCWLKGGTSCPARSGLHEHLAVVDQGPCITTQPSDAASALVALGATVTYDDSGSSTTVLVDELLAAPSDDDRRLHRLPHGAVIQHLDVPRPNGPSVYLKAMDRAAWQFALVGIAAVRHDDGVRLVASGVAATPYCLVVATEALDGVWTPDRIEAAARAATTGFEPGDRSRYKLPLVQALVRRALDDLA